ncbi:MAG TPA: RodZ domain-containing protein [Chloroflexota bacterium]|nr:RodZ domain-containing protein [Chloroflexota bacterium]
MAELGQQLREAREARGLSVDDVARGTRIRAAYIRALEEERFADLPAPVYVRGFLRNYATFLGLDAEELIGELEQERGGAFQSQHRPKPQQYSAPVWRGPSPRGMAGAALLVLLVGFIAFIFRQYSEFTASRSTSVFAASPSPTPLTLVATAVPIPTVTPIPTLPPAPAPSATAIVTRAAVPPTATVAHPTAVPPPPPSPTPKPTATQAAPLVLTLKAMSDSWVRVTVDGQVAFEGTLLPGTTRAWDGATFITVRFGNAGGVNVTFNGKLEGVAGQPGQVVERTFRLG